MATASGRDWKTLLTLGLLALLATLLNGLKPLHMDDAAYFDYAAQIAEHPLDPYGFDLLWGQEPHPANEVLAPPLLLYWWALGLRLFGQQPFLWKLWLLPFNLLLVCSLHALYRRFTPGLTRPLLCMTVLSPTVLPGMNLMLDVPALTLSLWALVLFLSAVDRHSVWTAVAAGLVAGLAMQTKYSAFVLPATLLLYALLFRQFRLGLLAAALAILVFVVWEGFVALRHGQSHFLCALSQQKPHPLSRWVGLLLPLVSLMGGLAPALGLLGLAALGRSRRQLLGAGAALLLGYVLVACVPEAYGTFLRNPNSGSPRFSLSHVVHGALGLFVAGTTATAAWQLLHRQQQGSCQAQSASAEVPRWRFGLGGVMKGNRVAWFLVMWLALEVLGYFLLSPFPAARRVLGVLVAASVVIGRLAAETCASGGRAALPRWIAAASVVLGLGYGAVDLCEAQAVRQGIEAARDFIRVREPGANTWFVGVWGSKFHAERAGMRPVVPDRSQLHAGDWLLVPEGPYPHQQLRLDPTLLERIDTLAVNDGLPLRTMMGYYNGGRPLEHLEGPRFAVTLYRAKADFAAVTPR